MFGDGGGVLPALGRTVSGRFRVAKTLVNGMREWGRYSGISWRDVLVKRGPGQVFTDASGRALGVMALTVVDGRISSVDAVVNPGKWAHLGEVGRLDELQHARAIEAQPRRHDIGRFGGRRRSRRRQVAGVFALPPSRSEPVVAPHECPERLVHRTSRA
jgi:hypothetical protein